MRLITTHDELLTISNTALASSRIICSTAISILGVYLFNDSSNFLGASGEFTTTSIVLSIYWIISAILCISGLGLKQFWTMPLTCTSSSISALTFVLVMSEGPLLSGPIFLYQSYIAITSFLYERITSKSLTWKVQLSSFQNTNNIHELWLMKFRKACCHFIAVTNVLFLSVLGFKITTLSLITNATYVSVFISIIISLGYLYLRLRYSQSKQSTLIMLCLLILSIALLQVSHGAFSIVLLFLFFLSIVGCFILQSPLLKGNSEGFQSAPALFILLSISGLISLGTLFLCLPQSSATAASINFMHALFTAVSSVCVTGLSIVDINKQFSSFGVMIILILIQIGGLGIMVLSIFATIALGGRLGVRTEKAFSDFFLVKGVKSTNQLIIFIVISTLAIEIIGASFFFYDYYYIQNLDLGHSIKHSIFHAVSAFCNAGFSLNSNSLNGIYDSPWLLTIYGILIILGGLGFVVMLEIVGRLLKKPSGFGLSVQTKIVIIMTTILVFGGGVLLLLIEWDHAYQHLTINEKIFNSIFHSISLRTAGFHTIEIQNYTYGAWVIMLFFMFIGGAPGGTAGGIKLTTFAAILATLPALVQNNTRVTIFKKECSMQTVAKSSALIILSFSTIAILWFLLLITQQSPPMDLLFEVFSAIGTVGLSSGVTENLNIWGQIVILLGMFIGRIGPLTLAIALAQDTKSKIIYPSADIMIG